MYPLRMDGTNVIAYKDAPYDKGSQIVTIDGGSLKSTLLLENPSDRSVRDAVTSVLRRSTPRSSTAAAACTWARRSSSKPYSASDSDKKFLFMATGTG